MCSTGPSGEVYYCLTCKLLNCVIPEHNTIELLLLFPLSASVNEVKNEK